MPSRLSRVDPSIGGVAVASPAAAAGLPQHAVAGTPTFARAFGLAVLMLAPAAAAVALGGVSYAKYVALGTVAAVQIGVMARHEWGMALYLPIVYAAGSIASESIVVAAIVLGLVAATAAWGARDGSHRGLVALVVLGLIGAFEPADAEAVTVRVASVLAGAVCGLVLVHTLLKHVSRPAVPVDATRAGAHVARLALLVLLGWFAARGTGAVDGWWLPVTVALVAQPDPEPPPSKALLQSAGTFLGAMALVALAAQFDRPAARGAVVLVLLVAILRLDVGRRALFALLAAPLVVLIAGEGPLQAGDGASLGPAAVAILALLAAMLVGEAVTWLAHTRTRSA